MSNEHLLDGLNPEQQEAVTATEGPLLILAGAGSGKTRVLVHRLAYLVQEKGVDPGSLLAVTFTNKAAGEMRERVENLLGAGRSGLWVSTFHSTCVRILRRDIGALGRDQNFVIYDDSDSLGLIKQVLKRHSLDPKIVEPRRLRWKFDQWKNEGVLPGRALELTTDLEEERSAKLYETYQQMLLDANALDFGDLLLQTVVLFKEHPEVLEQYRQRFQYVLVDEYQDTNTVQYNWVKQLVSGHQNLCVVGDPDQSIYAWRGANLRNILDFERDYPEARVVRLERNYRSTQPILEGASALVAHNVERKSKTLYTEREGGELITLYEANTDREEAQYVVREIMTRQRESDASLSEMAIFYRTNAQSRTFEEELLKYNVPYVIVGGVRFYERAEVKDALSYLRVLVNCADEMGLRRIVNKPPRGIGKTSLDRASEMGREVGEGLLQGLRRFSSEGTGRSSGKVKAFLEMIDRLSKEIQDLGPGEAIARVLDASGYLRHLEKDGSPEAEGRIENLRELVSSAEEFKAENIEEFMEEGNAERGLIELFLDQVALVSDLDQADLGEEKISLMTTHSAKGLEFPWVYLVGMEEGLLPHAASSHDESGIEEERRLCYVGMTRAMEKLTLTCAAERMRFGKRSHSMPSRFLREIPQELLEVKSAPRRHRPQYSEGSYSSDVGGQQHSSSSSSWGRTGSSRSPKPRSGERRVDVSYSQEPAGEGETGVGTRVRHPVYGLGTILEVSGDDENRKFKIRFERAGVKKILVRYANLERA